MASCVICQSSLTILVDHEEKDEDSIEPNEDFHIDDDVHLKCDCHFHWQCLLDASFELTNCPNCHTNVTSLDSGGTQQILCNLNNEGGFQKDQDILPILTEESYLRAYPEERKARAFLEFCAEGDVEAILEILRTEEDMNTSERTITTSISPKVEILRYQDQLGHMSSALHTAVQNQRVEVAWLLLWLASSLDPSVFPSEVTSAAADLKILRTNYREHVEIRSLQDAEGATAYERAREIGGIWESWVCEGMFMKEPLLKAP